jgi:hypothetical protein
LPFLGTNGAGRWRWTAALISEPGDMAGMIEPIRLMAAFGAAPFLLVGRLAITSLPTFVSARLAVGPRQRLRLHRPNSCQEDWRVVADRPTLIPCRQRERSTLSARMGLRPATMARLVREHLGERSPSPCGRPGLQSRGRRWEGWPSPFGLHVADAFRRST